jgi:hypothetical protein
LQGPCPAGTGNSESVESRRPAFDPISAVYLDGAPARKRASISDALAIYLGVDERASGGVRELSNLPNGTKVSMREATLYGRSGRYYVHSSSKTTAGVWVAHAPFLTIGGEELTGLGQAMQECLLASREGVTHPSSWGGLLQPMLKLAGVKSYVAFARLSKCVTVLENDDRTVSLIPTRNGGSREGFVHLNDKTSTVENTLETLGTAAVEALARSE